MELTEEQKNLETQLKDFLEAKPVKDQDYFFTIEGFAGTGKTTILRNLVKNYTNKKIGVSAPTHKAKRNFSKSLSNCKAETIQALLGLRPSVSLDNYDPNKIEFKIKAEQRIKNFSIVIIDEAFMLNHYLFVKIKECALEFGTKIIFSGDRYQLPPIGEFVSKVSTIENRGVLNTVMRQEEGNPIQKLINSSREAVINKSSEQFLNLLNTESANLINSKGYEVLDKIPFYVKMIETFKLFNHLTIPDYTRVICYKNDTCESINNYIRSKIFNNPRFIEVNDFFTGYKTVSSKSRFGGYDTIIENSADYIVTAVEPLEFYIEDVCLNVHKTTIKTEEDKELVINILDPSSYSDFRFKYLEIEEYCQQKRKFDRLEDFKKEIILKENIIRYGTQTLVGKDIDYGYSITTHKSQGSTYDYCFVVLKDLFSCYKEQERRSLVYVALSRARYTNYIYR